MRPERLELGLDAADELARQHEGRSRPGGGTASGRRRIVGLRASARAFGVADQWAAKYRTEMGTEPPAPAYFAGGYAGLHTSNHLTQMVRDFDQTVSSAISLSVEAG